MSETEQNIVELQEEKEKATKKEVKIKKEPPLYRRDYFKVVIFSIIMLLTVLIPVVFGTDKPLTLVYQALPIIGTGEIVEMQVASIGGFFSLFGLQGQFANILNIIVSYTTHAFYFIILADILFSLILIIVPNMVCRKIFRCFSVLFSIIMLVSALSYLMCIVGFVGNILSLDTGGDITSVLSMLGPAFMSSGLIFYIFASIFSFTLMSKHFRWFKDIPF